MSVLINMEMPTSCWDCGFKVNCDVCEGYECLCAVLQRRISDCRLDDCPLVPIPPHGRLIDADALKVSLTFAEKAAGWAVPALRAVLMVIDEMPTVIPAEEDEA